MPMPASAFIGAWICVAAKSLKLDQNLKLPWNGKVGLGRQTNWDARNGCNLYDERQTKGIAPSLAFTKGTNPDCGKYYRRCICRGTPSPLQTHTPEAFFWQLGGQIRKGEVLFVNGDGETASDSQIHVRAGAKLCLYNVNISAFNVRSHMCIHVHGGVR